MNLLRISILCILIGSIVGCDRQGSNNNTPTPQTTLSICAATYPAICVD